MTIQKKRVPPRDYLKEHPQVRQGLKFVMLIILIIVAYLAVKWAIDIYTFEGVIVGASIATVNGLALIMLLFLMVSGFYVISRDYLEENPQVRQGLKFVMLIILIIVAYLAVQWLSLIHI